MRQQELMIGDLIMASVYEEEIDDDVYHPARIMALSSISELFDGNYSIDWLDDCESESCGDIEPIPLTEEILKENGFESHEHEHTLRKRSSYNEYYHIDFYVTLDGVFILDIESANDKGTMSRVHNVIQFVHELQHALRLCGLQEFADNFKIH